jgi:hypothetical protein
MSEEKTALQQARELSHRSNTCTDVLLKLALLSGSVCKYEQAVIEERMKARREMAEKAIELVRSYIKIIPSPDPSMYACVDFADFNRTIRAEAEKE